MLFQRTFKSIHLIWKDGMRNPLDLPPGERSTMFKPAIKQQQP